MGALRVAQVLPAKGQVWYRSIPSSAPFCCLEGPKVQADAGAKQIGCPSPQ